MNYIVVIGKGTGSYNSFLSDVNIKVQDGYTPIGGITIRGNEYLQAMFKAPVVASNETSPPSNTRGRGRPKKLDINPDS